MTEGAGVYRIALALLCSWVSSQLGCHSGPSILHKQWGHINMNICTLLLGGAHLHSCGVTTFSCSHWKSPLLISRHLWESSQQIWRARSLICWCLFAVCCLWVTRGSISPLSLAGAVLNVSVPSVALSPTVPHFITWAPLSLYKSQSQGVPPQHNPLQLHLQPSAILQSPPSKSYPCPLHTHTHTHTHTQRMRGNSPNVTSRCF